MLFQAIDLFAFLLLIGISQTLISCPGPSPLDKSLEGFSRKVNTSSIVGYGVVTETNGNHVAFRVHCSIKGQMTKSTVHFIQPDQVESINQCHYLKTNKTYLVFLQSLTTLDADAEMIYRLDDKEEIEINVDLAKNFLEQHCRDKSQYGNVLSIFYADSTNQCKRSTMTCNEKTSEEMANFYSNASPRKYTFLGGTEEKLWIGNSSDTMINAIAGKSGTSIGDDVLRNDGYSVMSVMPLILVMTLLTVFCH